MNEENGDQLAVVQDTIDTIDSVKRKLKSGIYKAVDVSHNRKSKTWGSFDLVVNIEDNKSIGYVSCRQCSMLYRYNPKQGNSHLLRHKCSLARSAEESQSNLNSFVIKKSKYIPDHIKKESTLLSIKFCSLDLRSMESIAGQGLKELAQFLVNTRAQLGQINVGDILPDPTTVSRNATKIAEEKRNELFELIWPYLMDNMCSATTDMWTDDYKKISYIGLTFHYITDDWILKKHHVMSTSMFPINEAKTGENIRKHLTTLLNRNLEQSGSTILSKLNFVTDQGSNILSALNSYARIRLNCSCHVINNVLKNTFSDQFLKSDQNIELMQPVIDTIEQAKALVRFMKKNGSVNKMPKTLIQEVETRWNSRLEMLMSVNDQFNAIVEVLGADHYRLERLDRSILKSLIQFLEPFKSASTDLEGSNFPTLNKVLLHKVLLVKHLKQYDQSDCRILKVLARRAYEEISARLILTRQHEMATFLWPKFRKLKMIDDENEKNRILSEVKMTLASMQFIVPISQEIPVNTFKNNIGTMSKFVEWEDDDPDSVEDYTTQLLKYQNDHFNALNVDNNILIWWKKHELQYPLLAKLAKQLLAIPASSAASERCFSAAGRTLEERRTRLKPSTVDSLLFLHDYYNT